MKKNIKEYTNNFFKEAKKNINDLKSIKTIPKQIPNLLTFSRALAPVLINILFFADNIPGALVVCGLTFLTDAFDGPIARKLNVQSQFGADLDAICDKVLIAGISIPIVILNPMMLINVALEVLISITNVKAKLRNKNPKSSILGKAKTWVLSLTVLSGYITSLLNLDLNLLKSILMIIPATIAQSATYIEYLKRNNNDKKENTKIENKPDNKQIILEPKKENKNKLEKEYKRTFTLEDYEKLKQELLENKYQEENEKTKKLDFPK